MIGFGSSIGDDHRKKQYIIDALKFLVIDHFTLIDCSDIYQNHPQGKVAKNEFSNGVVLVYSEDPPDRQLTKLLAIEKSLGRVRAKKNQDRIIDLDLIITLDNNSSQMVVLKGNSFSNSNIILPHPRAHQRSFVMEPMQIVINRNPQVLEQSTAIKDHLSLMIGNYHSYLLKKGITITKNKIKGDWWYKSVIDLDLNCIFDE